MFNEIANLTMYPKQPSTHPPSVMFFRIFVTALMILLLCSSCTSKRLNKSPVAPQLREFAKLTNSQQQLAELQTFLARHQVQNVIPLEQILKQGTAWESKKLPQFAIPDRSLWPKMVSTLKLMQRFIIPAVGPVEVVSGFRTEKYNLQAGGAPRSKHLEFSALDVVPQSTTDRAELHRKLLSLWRLHGPQLAMGLGLYSNNRFHIDTGGHRHWRG